jgi:hypothetical protein
MFLGKSLMEKPEQDTKFWAAILMRQDGQAVLLLRNNQAVLDEFVSGFKRDCPKVEIKTGQVFKSEILALLASNILFEQSPDLSQEGIFGIDVSKAVPESMHWLT